MSAQRPAFLHAFDAVDHAEGWLIVCPVRHLDAGYAVLVRADERAGRYRFQCLAARNGDLCSDESDLLALLDLEQGESAMTEQAAWFESAAHLLGEPDPGPTPFLVEDLIADGAIVGLVGPHKSWKTWMLLDLAIAVVTGTPALGRFAVAEPGPVLLILEESGRAALHRRLDRLVRGRALCLDEAIPRSCLRRPCGLCELVPDRCRTGAGLGESKYPICSLLSSPVPPMSGPGNGAFFVFLARTRIRRNRAEA